MRNLEEARLQRSVLEWLRYAVSYKGRPLSEYVYHVPNNRRTRVEGAILKGLGVKAGVADLVLPIRTKDYGGLYLELKVCQRTLSEAQAHYHLLLRDAGQQTATAWTLEDAIKITVTYLHGEAEFKYHVVLDNSGAFHCGTRV